MVRAQLLRGAMAGLVGGLLAGLLALVIGRPLIAAAEAVEAAATGQAPAAGVPDLAVAAGLVLGSGIAGIALGLVLGLAAAWATGRLRGEPWQRALVLGGVGLAAGVLLPWVAAPPNPPGIGDPATLGGRTVAHLALIGVGVLTAAAARLALRALADAGIAPALRHALVGAGVLGVVVLAVAVSPPASAVPAELPAELLWRFRLTSLALQATLVGATTVVFGLAADRAARTGAPAPAPAPTSP